MNRLAQHQLAAAVCALVLIALAKPGAADECIPGSPGSCEELASEPTQPCFRLAIGAIHCPEYILPFEEGWVGVLSLSRNKTTFRARGGARFLRIADFPTGSPAGFRVQVPGVGPLGIFGPGESVDFTTLDPAGVTEFSVLDELELVADPEPLPIKLGMSAAGVEITTWSEIVVLVPALSLPAAIGVGAALAAAGALRLRSTSRPARTE